MDINELGLEGEVLDNVSKLIQSETDKVRTEYSTKIKDLEKYKPIEKSESEIALEERLKALETKEQELNKRERLDKVSNTLKEKGLNTELSKYLNVTDDVDLETYINDIAKVIREQATYVPNKGNSKANGNITKADFKNMNYLERTNLYNTNKELYDILSK
jgi:hypothetical protein